MFLKGMFTIFFFFFILKEKVNVIFTHLNCVTETLKQAYSDFVVDVDELISVFDGFEALSFYQFLITLPLLFARLIKRL